MFEKGLQIISIFQTTCVFMQEYMAITVYEIWKGSIMFYS